MKFKAKLGDPDLILNGQLNVIPSAVDVADRLIARGYRLLVGFDVVWLKSAFSHSVGWCGRYAAPDQSAPSGTGAR